MKRVLFSFLSCILGTSAAHAHSGGLDANGGHYDRSNGTYHLHRPAPPPPPPVIRPPTPPPVTPPVTPPPVVGVSPTITTHPQGRTVTAGTSFTMTVAATGTSPLSYRWERDNTVVSGGTAASLTIASAAAANAGNYRCTVSNAYGSVSSNIAAISVAAPIARFVSNPQPVSVRVGGTAVLTGQATGIEIAYQWYLNDSPIIGATSASYTVSNTQPWLAGSYKLRATNSGGSVVSGSAAVSVTSGAASTESRPRLANISTRGYVGSGSEAMVIGFVTTGQKPQRLLIRAAGPALAGFGITGFLRDPLMTLFTNAGAVSRVNDDWTAVEVGTFTQLAGAFAFGAGSRDSAVGGSFAPGQYTIQVRGSDDGTGVAVIEAYDIDSTEEGVRLANLSTRGLVGVAGENLTAGLVVSGTTPRRVLVRAVGPALVGFGVLGALADPVMTVFSGAGIKLFENDDWSIPDNPSVVVSAAARAGAFALPSGSKDAAVLAYLPPGPYTFVVTSKTGATGIALLEAYDVD